MNDDDAYRRGYHVGVRSSDVRQQVEIEKLRETLHALAYAGWYLLESAQILPKREPAGVGADTAKAMAEMADEIEDSFSATGAIDIIFTASDREMLVVALRLASSQLSSHHLSGAANE
jgi:hypothetical protein